MKNYRTLIESDKSAEEILSEAMYTWMGVMTRDLKVGGKSYHYPFADTPEVQLKKGQKVKVVLQSGSMGDLWQFHDAKTGKKFGSRRDIEDIDSLVKRGKQVN